MKYSAALVAATLASVAQAHTRIYSAWVNGVDQGDGRSVYIRSPPTNNPVKDLTSTDLVCNTAGGTAVSDFVSAAAGDEIAFEWYHDNRGDDIIASSHKGPIQVYIAPYTTDNGASAIWSKIASQGYDASTSTWAVDDLIANSGKHTFTIPSDLAAGKYLIRGEIIALHEADTDYTVNSARGAQFYPSCVQFDITGSGSAVPDTDFDFNTGYTEADPGIVFNLYGSFTSYTAPGPAIWSATSTSGSTSTSSTTSAAAAAPATTTAAAVVASSSSAAAVVASSSSSSTTVAAAATTPVYTSVSGPTTFATSVVAATSTSAAPVAATSAAAAGDDECDA